MDNLMEDDELLLDPVAIAECISQFYKHLYFENGGDELEFSRKSKEESTQLYRPFKKEEVFGM